MVLRKDVFFHIFFLLCFSLQCETIHRLETNKLRNVAKFFAHLLFTDAIPWTVSLLSLVVVVVLEMGIICYSRNSD